MINFLTNIDFIVWIDVINSWLFCTTDIYVHLNFVLKLVIHFQDVYLLKYLFNSYIMNNIFYQNIASQNAEMTMRA